MQWQTMPCRRRWKKKAPAKPRATRTKAPAPDTSEVLGQILTIVNTDTGLLANYFPTRQRDLH